MWSVCFLLHDFKPNSNGITNFSKNSQYQAYIQVYKVTITIINKFNISYIKCHQTLFCSFQDAVTCGSTETERHGKANTLFLQIFFWMWPKAVAYNTDYIISNAR